MRTSKFHNLQAIPDAIQFFGFMFMFISFEEHLERLFKILFNRLKIKKFIQ